MNQNEKLVAKKTARIIRAARKRNGMTQTAVAQLLGTSQANVSKLENGILIPSALEWFEFCAATGISPESIRTGYLDRGEPAVLRSERMEAGFSLPARYAENRGSKIRTSIPILRYFKSIHGEEKTAEFIEAQKLDPDLFIDLNNQISLAFFLDVARNLIRDGKLKSGDDFGKLGAQAKDPDAHGKFHAAYDECAQPANLIQLLVGNAKSYEINFAYQIQESRADRLVLSVTPERHLRDVKYRGDADLGDFLCEYKKQYFRAFSSYRGSPQAALKELECHFHGAERCVYELRPAT